MADVRLGAGRISGRAVGAIGPFAKEGRGIRLWIRIGSVLWIYPGFLVHCGICIAYHMAVGFGGIRRGTAVFSGPCSGYRGVFTADFPAVVQKNSSDSAEIWGRVRRTEHLLTLLFYSGNRYQKIGRWIVNDSYYFGNKKIVQNIIKLDSVINLRICYNEV